MSARPGTPWREFAAAVRADHAAMRAHDERYAGPEGRGAGLVRDLVVRIGFQMMFAYRVMRLGAALGIPLAPQIVSRLIRHLYGADIHWDAELAPGVTIVHGMGMCINGSARVGAGAILFQNVTLGLSIHPETRAIGAPELGRDVHVAPGATLVGRQRRVGGDSRTERVGPAVLGDVGGGGPDDLERSRLTVLGGAAPGRDPVPAQDRPDRLRLLALDGGDVEAQLEPGPTPRDPGDPVAEGGPGERLAVRGRGEGDPGVGVEVVDVGGIHQAVHRRVDGRRGPAAAVEAIVERGDHLVLAFHARIRVHEAAQAVQPEDREAGLGQGPKVAAGALDPEQLDGLAHHRIDADALRRGVAAGVIRVRGIGAEPVRAREQLDNGRARSAGIAGDGLGVSRRHAPHPACCPPTRSAAICSK